MENIIQQIMVEFTEKFYKRINNNEYLNLDIFTENILEDCKETSVKMVSTFLEEINETVRKDKRNRKIYGLKIKEKDRSREILTPIGQLKFKRDYYYNECNDEYVYPLDKIIELDGYERLTKGISATLLNQAATMSFGKSAEIVTKGAISRQTVKNKLVEVDIPLIKPPAEPRKVEEIHIYADEDHVHMQKPNKEKGKQNKIVPLITLSEGREEISKSRNKLKNPIHFSDINRKPVALWEEVCAYMEMAYEIEENSKIYIHGDGGKWIKSGNEVISKSIPVIDGFHIERIWKELNRIYKDKQYGKRIRAALEKSDQKLVKETLLKLRNEEGTEKEKVRVEEIIKYIKNNIRAIISRYTKTATGSCTEAQVSHILSERLSRSPMGWSKDGLSQMVKLRTYIKNGKKITRDSFKNNGSGSVLYKDYWNMYEEKLLSKKRNWQIFEKEDCNFAEQSATQILVNAYGKMYNPS